MGKFIQTKPRLNCFFHEFTQMHLIKLHKNKTPIDKFREHIQWETQNPYWHRSREVQPTEEARAGLRKHKVKSPQHIFFLFMSNKRATMSLYCIILPAFLFL